MGTAANPILLGATPGVDIAAAVEVYEATGRTAREVYGATRRTAWEVYEATRHPAWAVYEATERTAREALTEAVSADPLATWIVANALADYEDEALTVLRALPATSDALHAIADEYEWCGVWRRMWSRARAAGVLAGEATERA